MYRLKNIAFTILIIAFSCTRDIEIELPKAESILVANSTLQENTKTNIMISHLVSMLEEDEQNWISGAQVILYENNIPVDTLKWTIDGLYTSDFLPQKNKLYSFKASALGYPTISAQCIIPQKPIIEKTSINDSSIVIDSEGKFFLTQFKFNIKDPENEENFYSIAVKEKTNDDYLILKTLKDPIISSEGLDAFEENGELKQVYISDKLFNGKSQTFSIYFYNPISNSEDELYVEIRALTKDLFDFEKKLLFHKNNQQGNIFTGYLQPIMQPSNIKDGLGIFGAENIIFDTIKKTR